MKKPYTPDQVLKHLAVIAANLTQPPAPTERAWIRWVIADIQSRGIAVEGASVEDAQPATLEIDPTDSHEWGCTCKICGDYWNTKPPV